MVIRTGTCCLYGLGSFAFQPDRGTIAVSSGKTFVFPVAHEPRINERKTTTILMRTNLVEQWQGKVGDLAENLHTFTKQLSIMKLFVAGLPYDLDDAELEEIFEKFGTIASAKVAIDKETGKSRGFAFVEMPNEEEAKEAIEHLNDISLGKKPLVVKAAEDKGPSQGGG